jgi:hypothetical protein
VTPQEQSLADAFARFAAALQSADAATFRALTVTDATPQEALFLQNAKQVKERGWTLQLRELRLEGEVGEARFELVDGKGTRADEGSVSFTLESGGWKLRAL